MRYQIKVEKVRSVDEIPNYWTEDDYRKLLELFEVSDVDQITQEELRDYLFMAITDVEDHEAANLLLTYKLAEELSEGQIEQLSHEMKEDKVAEEYPDIHLHAPLFHVNQLLHKAYNGIFPSTRASMIEVQVEAVKEGVTAVLSKAELLQVLQSGWKESNIIKRLFADQLNGTTAFPEAEHILWELHHKGGPSYQLVTSDYWLNRDDFAGFEFAGEVVD